MDVPTPYIVSALNIAFCITPIFQILTTNTLPRTGHDGKRYVLPRSGLAIVSLLANFTCSVIYLIYNLNVFDDLPNTLGSFIQFILNGYIVLQSWSYEHESYGSIPEMESVHPRTVVSELASVDEEQVSSTFAPMTSPKSVASDTMVFSFDDNLELPITEARPKSLYSKLHAPVMATLLALTPVASNAMPIGHAMEEPNTPSSSPSYFLSLALVNFTLVVVGKLAQIWKLSRDRQAKAVGASVPFFALESAILAGYLLTRTLVPEAPRFLYIFESTWQFSCVIALNCLILMTISMTTEESDVDDEDSKLAKELKNRLHSYQQSGIPGSDELNAAGEVTYGSITYDDITYGGQ